MIRVADLMAKLQAFPPDAVVYTFDGDAGGYEDLVILSRVPVGNESQVPLELGEIHCCSIFPCQFEDQGNLR